MVNFFCNSCDGIYNSLDIRFTKNCDNNCSFCIEKNGLPKLEETSPVVLAAKVKETNIKNILILGGEPFLEIEKLKKFINLIKNEVDTIYITTSLPKTFIDKKDIIKEILNNVTGLNISLNDTTPTINNILFNASSYHNRLEIIRELCIDYKDKIRINLNLSKSGIHTRIRLLKSLADLEHIGCKNVKINELQNSEEYVSYEDIMRVKLPAAYSKGCQTEIKIASFSLNIILKRSCFIVEQSRKAKVSDLIKVLFKSFFKRKNKFAVLYENGQLEKGWIKC